MSPPSSSTLADSDLLFEMGVADVLTNDERYMYTQLEVRVPTMPEREIRMWADFASRRVIKFSQSSSAEPEWRIAASQMGYYLLLEELFGAEQIRRTKVPDEEAEWM